MALPLSVISGFVLAAFAPWIHSGNRNISGWILALLPAGLFIYYLTLLGSVMGGHAVQVSYPWIPSLDINFSFYADGLALIFALLISGIGTFIVIYAGGYLHGHPNQGRMFLYLLMFMGSMLGVVLAGNLITLFIFWELTSLSSYLLIGFNNDQEKSRKAALQALVVTGCGGLAMLAGFILLGVAAGSFELAEVLTSGDAVRAHALYIPILILVLIGAFTKSAQFPFHYWLPSAMEAPTPVSAYLHSATMVKAGVYLLARLHPTLGGTDQWALWVTAFGAATMLTGAFLAVVKTDLKQLLAYSTIASLGLLVMLLGLGTPYAIKGCIVFLVAHALYKGALFMIAGAVDHETGTRDVDKLGGLRKFMPVTAAIALIAGLSMAGLGPFLSFIGKELFLEAVWQAEAMRLLILTVSIITGVSFVAVAAIVVIRPFFGVTVQTPKKAHEAPVSMWIGPAVLAVLGVFGGIIPAIPGATLSFAVSDVLGYQETLKLALWHGINPPLILSFLSLVLGALVFAGWSYIRQMNALGDGVLRYGPSAWYDGAFNGLFGLARIQTLVIQNGYLRYYLLYIILTTLGLVLFSITGAFQTTLIPADAFEGVKFYEVVLALLIFFAAISAAASTSRVGAIVSLGAVGVGIALIFIIYGAPDLAKTQFLIEILTVILFVLVFLRLPRFARLSRPASRVRDAIIAGVAGMTMTVLVLAANQIQMYPSISGYFSEYSYTEAFGRNVVNVILVDFRALDTLGEITVLALAGIGVYALLKLRMQRRDRQ